jgi:adenylate cyclase
MARSALSQLGPASNLLEADLHHIWARPGTSTDLDTHAAALRQALRVHPGQQRDELLTAALADDGELLADEPYSEWALQPREHLEALRQEARLALARDRANGAGRARPEDVVEAWESCLGHDPTSEEAATALMRAYSAQGRRHHVLRAYERCRTALGELGLLPSPALEQVFASCSFQPGPPRFGPAPSSPKRLREERKVVTVLFAGLALPTGQGRQADPEDIREAVGEALARVTAEVEALGGTVTSVSGGGVQALFGAPESHEDDPERALRAAWRALSALATVPGNNAPTLRIGVETGPAVVGPIGAGSRVDYAAVGEVVGIAALLEPLARAGSALVGPSTRAATEDLFTWGPTEEVTVGKEQKPLLASYLGQARARGSPRRGRLAGPIIGRHDELELLAAALRETVAGRGMAVFILGEPGLGKSRLVQECRRRFMAWVGAGTGRLPLWLEGRSASYASSTPYGLYQQMMASWIGVAADQDEPLVRGALGRALRALMGNDQLLAVLARMMGLPGGPALLDMGPEKLQQATFAAMRSVVSRLMQAGPTVLALEDLHWADPTSLRLTAELAGLASEGPLLVMATTRPEGAAELDGLAASVAPIVPAKRIELYPLSEEEERGLARSLVGGSGADKVVDTVRQGADGNPLFLEERFSSLVETGALIGERGAWRLAEATGGEISPVLERLVQCRVDRLSEPAQELVRTASVLGTEFPLSLLSAVYGSTLEVRTAIGELSDRDLLQEVAGAAEASYRFRHALIQQAIYGGVVRGERRRMHSRAAFALEATAQGRLTEVAVVLGRHFAAGGEMEAARRYFEMAGDHAEAAFASDESIASYRSAIALLGNGPDEGGARLWGKLAQVLWRTGRRPEASEALHAAIRSCGPGDVLQLARLHALLGLVEKDDHRYDAAMAAFRIVAELLVGEHAPTQEAEAADIWLRARVEGLAHLLIHLKEGATALAVLEEARPVVEATRNPIRMVDFYRLVASQRAFQNRYCITDEDIADMRKAVAAAREAGDEFENAWITMALGWFLLLKGELAEGQEHVEASLAMAERTGAATLRAADLAILVFAARLRRDPEAAHALIPTCLAACESGGAYPEWVGGVKGTLAWLAWQEDRGADAIAIAREAAGLYREDAGTEVFLKWLHLWPLAAAQLGVGELGETVAAIKEMLEPDQQQMPAELERVMAAACSAWQQGHPRAAAARLAEAVQLASKLGYL